MHASLMSRLLILLLGLAISLASQAQLNLEITNPNVAARPIAVVPIQYQGAGMPLDTDISGVITADLNRSGQFYVLERSKITEFPTRDTEVDFQEWNTLKQDYLVVGRVLDAESGALRVEFELFDVAKKQRLLAQAVGARASSLRATAHQIADIVYEKITGVRGAFSTRIAYVTQKGLSPKISYSVMVADSDGYNPVPVISWHTPFLSPAWSPDGRKLAYVSFERGNSAIYIHELTTGKREMIASYRGINGAPAFSPDGSKLALTLSQSGNPEIYVMDLATRRSTQLTRHYAIDTEPVWTQDGQFIIFTSDRAGKPQLYQIPAAGGEPTRITFQGEYNARASLANDGKLIAMAQGNKNVYRIVVLDRSRGGAGEVRELSPGNLDESPSFAPNGSMILYAAREDKRDVLYAVSADGRVRQRLVLADGDVRSPAWSPFRQR
ncbi:Tol-Pal system beta propeller repeat protein TolB [Ahniella affigens]|uniref:Tol-Pal system protein TolB n=1 Tax=Ahniella affigens TaxID=2021234 RepID=A0A2P1PY87_9GAMM|nr:Tol-Pal system beta propeller repeat protein TolB [Ahniella affigens]AVP99808.1 Tol-Pal system beta propeller repeat protein TolB [Ahniella affigens]